MSAEPLAGWKPIYPPGWEEGSAFVSGKRVAAAFIWVRGCTWVVLLLLASCSRLAPVSGVDLPRFRREVGVSGSIGFTTRRSKGRPYIYMNGVIVGISEQGYAFYRNVPAGVYSAHLRASGNFRTTRS